MRSSIAEKIAGGNSLPDSVRKAAQLHLISDEVFGGDARAEGESEGGVSWAAAYGVGILTSLTTLPTLFWDSGRKRGEEAESVGVGRGGWAISAGAD
jgi:hypothetical protein